MNIIYATLGIIITFMIGITILLEMDGQEICEQQKGRYEFVECVNDAGLEGLAEMLGKNYTRADTSMCGSHCYVDGKDIFANLTAISGVK